MGLVCDRDLLKEYRKEAIRHIRSKVITERENPLTHLSFSKEKEEEGEEEQTHLSSSSVRLPLPSFGLVLVPSSQLHRPQPTPPPARVSPRWYRAYLAPRY